MLSLDSHYKPLYVYAELGSKRSEFTYQQTGKRIFDICFSLLVTLMILSWLIPLVGIIIRLTSKGPILYVQKRTGYRGAAFNCLKFRTMTHNPTASFRQAIKNDDRVTPIGRFLRRTNLDEMPQFLNVLKGEMSIVGPRPHALPHSAQFWNTMPDYRKRYRVKPGITGLAQVRGCRGETDLLIKMKHRVKYDRFYNRKKSFMLDLWVCWLTIVSMIKRDRNAW
ncbi:putative colanic acid biosynthesis UDP-glucose lipid carrier transferase [Spirosoma oryzae]|uniref:Putative colanic acid biosynthesis UDP-glucose lipid carrier transferase n=1 Tax=Spirosoma oryzae TaxID=1469603 RepID=A0A2T0TET3_9BACT|nr:sugar transferase [Spirosoma oryzae]PRY44177.1 putative colanic acid biosynthesis UDP-glucose lipid carrier transferase [Spirosoma oryzae]